MTNAASAPGKIDWKAGLVGWGTPAILVAILVFVVGIGNGWLSSRFTTVEDRVSRLEKGVQDFTTRSDQRFDQIGQRIDKLIDAQSALAVQIAKQDVSLSQLNERVGRISQKLNVAFNSDATTGDTNLLNIPPHEISSTNPIDVTKLILDRSGIRVFGLDDFSAPLTRDEFF